MKKLIRVVLALIVVQVPLMASGQTWLSKLQGSASQMEWQFSPYTYHFSYSEEHRPVVMVGLERSYADGKLDGMTLFSNSFGQECVYIYPWGQVYKNLFGVQPLSFKWTAGLLYGYKEPYENKVPMNYKGFSPGLIAAVAYQFPSGWTAQVDTLGTAALMFQINVPFKSF